MCNLSIIVPIYNVEQYLENCINSILNQTYRNFELILVDDGSPDKSGEICDKYKSSDDRVKVIHKKNGGLSSARNAGLEIATGQYIGFVDSDDWIDRDMYDKLLNLAEKNEADIVQCEYLEAYDNKIIIHNNENSEFVVLDRFEALEKLINFGKYHVNGVVSWNKIYKRTLFDDIRFPVGKLNEDEFTTYKLLHKCNSIIFLKEKLYYYRQTPNSIMNKKFNVKRLDLLDAVKELLIFLKSNNYHQFYELGLIRYETLLIQFYFKCQDLIDNNMEILQGIYDSYKSYFGEFLNNSKISQMHKLNNYIFYFSPNLYKKIQILRRRKLY